MITKNHNFGWLRSIGMLVVCWVFAFVPASEARAQLPRSPDLATYQRWVQEAAIAARRGERFSLERIAPDVILTEQVLLPGGETIPIDNRWLRDALDQPEPDLDLIADALETLLQVLQQPAGSFPPDALPQLDSLLSQPPFAKAEVPDEGLLADLIDWFMKVIEQLFKPVEHAEGKPMNVMAWILVALMVALIGWIILSLVRGIRGAVWREAPVRPGAPEAGDPLTSAAAIQEAQQMAQQRDYRMAVRYLYLASLLWLEEQGDIPHNPALTNREYLERMNNPELRDRLQPIVETFDQVWYGYRPLDTTAFVEYQQQVERLRSVH